ncbi:glycosyltransferase family 2 protein [Porticoccaceae bacterium]|nr:glycosyltransferase family 2 protein [Porticoccaceae bacterium]
MKNIYTARGELMIKVSVVIVNYRTAEMTINCIKSVLDTCDGDWWEVIVVDNFSNDESCKIIEAFIAACGIGAQISLIRNQHNGGYSAGNNIGINLSRGGHIVLLNSDAILGEKTVEKLSKCLDEDPGIGIASPGFYSVDGKQQNGCFRYPQPLSELVKAAATGPITRALCLYDPSIKLSNERTFPDWTSFACVMIRRKLFETVGMLDDEFFMYFEDIDFCRRARDSGWAIINDPNASVIHLGGGSSNVTTSISLRRRLPKYYYESRSRYYYKYYGNIGLMNANILWNLGYLVAICRKTMTKNYRPNICDKQWRDIWANSLNPKAPYSHPDLHKIDP